MQARLTYLSPMGGRRTTARLWSAAAAALFSLSLLAGCSSKPEETADTSSSVPPAQRAAAARAAGIGADSSPVQTNNVSNSNTSVPAGTTADVSKLGAGETLQAN